MLVLPCAEVHRTYSRIGKIGSDFKETDCGFHGFGFSSKQAIKSAVPSTRKSQFVIPAVKRLARMLPVFAFLGAHIPEGERFSDTPFEMINLGRVLFDQKLQRV